MYYEQAEVKATSDTSFYASWPKAIINGQKVANQKILLHDVACLETFEFNCFQANRFIFPITPIEYQ